MMENTQAPEKPRTDKGLVSELTHQVTLIRGYTQLLMREHQKLGLAQPRVHQCTHAILEQTERLQAIVHRSQRQTWVRREGVGIGAAKWPRRTARGWKRVVHL